MCDTTYVVHLVNCGHQKPFQHFQHRTAAVRFAAQQTSRGEASRAEVFELVGISDAKEAVAALVNGKGNLVEIGCSHALQDTLDRDAVNQEWGQAQKGDWPAVFKFFGML